MNRHQRTASFVAAHQHDQAANAAHDTRALQAWLGHRNIQHTVRYTELASDRFKDSGDRSEMAILIHEQVRRTLYYPNDRRLRQFGAFGETKISIEAGRSKREQGVPWRVGHLGR